MSERYGACPHCKGMGSTPQYYECLEEWIRIECGTCGGTGFWGGAFSPESYQQMKEENL